MKRSLLALAAMLVLGMIPTAGQATPEGIECGGTVAAGETASCSVHFNLEKDASISLLGTHANFENLLGMGTLDLRWIDADGAVVVEYSCQALGLPDPLDDQRLLCSETSPAADTYAKGLQTVEVDVVSADSCPTGDCVFEGGFVFNDEGDPI